ncbi:spore germination protein [Desulfotomaculum sp. 1211_IL3151]|uniref:spore germination protein n=1 Tax=Desulfotomaculum sp. 1211_IL3151 TaxID=3084055 RepID=UPI003FA56C71
MADFLVPSQNDSSSILRFVMMVLTGFVGFYDVAMGFLALLVHLSTLTSFGVSYFDGFAVKSNMQDSLARMPLLFTTSLLGHGNILEGTAFFLHVQLVCNFLFRVLNMVTLR